MNTGGQQRDCCGVPRYGRQLMIAIPDLTSPGSDSYQGRNSNVSDPKDGWFGTSHWRKPHIVEVEPTAVEILGRYYELCLAPSQGSHITSHAIRDFNNIDLTPSFFAEQPLLFAYGYAASFFYPSRICVRQRLQLNQQRRRRSKTRSKPANECEVGPSWTLFFGYNMRIAGQIPGGLLRRLTQVMI